MQNVRLIISLVLIAHGVVIGAQYRVLDVCIQVKVNQSFRKGSIPADELEKYGRFGMIEAMPFDQYFRVSSALYDDYVDSNQHVEIKKNLLRNVPEVIKYDSSKSALLEQYKFPKFLPKIFIEKLEHSQKDHNPLQHVIYKNKDNGNTKTLALRYWIGDIIRKEELPKSLILFQQDESIVGENNRAEVFSVRDYVIDLLDVLALFTLVTTK